MNAPDQSPPPPPAPLRPRSRRVMFYTLIALLLVVLALVLLIFWRFLIIIGLATAMTLLLKPLHVRLTAWMRGRTGLAAMTIAVVVAVIILVPVLGGLAVMGTQALNFYEWIAPRLTNLELERVWNELLPRKLPWLAQIQEISQGRIADFFAVALSRLASGANNLLQNAVAGLTSAAFEVTLLLIALYFFLRDGPYFRAQIRRVSPLTNVQIDEMLDQMGQTMQGALSSLLLVPIIQGVIATIGYWLFGVPNALLWGGLTTLVAFVPALGTPLAWVPICIYLFVKGQVWQGIGLTVYCVFLVTVIDNVIRAWMLKGKAKIHPLWSFFAILGGLLTFGAVGLLVGPLILSLGVWALQVYETDVLRGPPLPAPSTADAQAKAVIVERK